jgi:hypothetical protein
VKLRDYAVDAGLGSEASVTVRDFEVLLSVVVAHTFRGAPDIKGNKVLVSARTSR